MKNVFLVSIIAIASAGCAFHPQKANINPSVSVSKSEVGNGVAIGLRVSDERPTKSLGRRGNGAVSAAEISSDQDVAEVFKQKITEGLKAKGFTVVGQKQATTTLTIEIRGLAYKASAGFWTGRVSVEAAMKVISRRTGADDFERMYLTDKERRILIVPTAGKNEGQINAAASELLEKMFADGELIEYLSARQGS